MATKNKPRLYIGVYEYPSVPDSQQWTLIVSAKSQHPPFGRAKKFFVAPEASGAASYWGRESWVVRCVDLPELSRDPGLLTLNYVGKIACGLTDFERKVRALPAYGRVVYTTAEDGDVEAARPGARDVKEKIVAECFSSREWICFLLHREGVLRASEKVAYLAPWKTIEATVVDSAGMFKTEREEKPEAVVGVKIPVFDVFVADKFRYEVLLCGLASTPVERRTRIS
jgi:hypothetical protein